MSDIGDSIADSIKAGVGCLFVGFLFIGLPIVVWILEHVRVVLR